MSSLKQTHSNSNRSKESEDEIRRAEELVSYSVSFSFSSEITHCRIESQMGYSRIGLMLVR